MKKIVYFLVICLVFVGCYKDRSSTRWEPIGSIIVEGIQREYRLAPVTDTLRINPVVRSTDPNDNVAGFEYLWTYYNVSRGDIDTISRTKNLVFPITLSSGVYRVVLRVTNPDNGYTVFHTTTLRVATVFSLGFYFLKETSAGHTELDFFTPRVWGHDSG